MITILQGDARKIPLADGTVQCCVTSPPYFGLRNYGVDGQIGLEPSPEAYVAQLVEVFRGVRRVLSEDGTLWLNLGDSYCYAANRAANRAADYGLKPKDLIGIPWAVAFALRADGWYLRQDIIWHNPMPESVRDRCTKAHEYMFLLAKSPRYYFDHEAMKEPASAPPKKCGPKNDASRNDSGRTGIVRGDGKTRNRRSVWTVATKPFKCAHLPPRSRGTVHPRGEPPRRSGARSVRWERNDSPRGAATRAPRRTHRAEPRLHCHRAGTPRDETRKRRPHDVADRTRYEPGQGLETYLLKHVDAVTSALCGQDLHTRARQGPCQRGYWRLAPQRRTRPSSPMGGSTAPARSRILGGGGLRAKGKDTLVQGRIEGQRGGAWPGL